MSAAPLVQLLRSIQVEPRTTPGVATPSPFQSPVTGMSPAAPKLTVVVAGPEVSEPRISQVVPRTTTGRDAAAATAPAAGDWPAGTSTAAASPAATDSAPVRPH